MSLTLTLRGIYPRMYNVLSFPARRPVVFGLGFSMVKTGFADWLVQRYIEKREQIDWRRNMTFSMFGLVYLGGWQYFLYCKMFPKMFPSATGFASMSFRQKLRNTQGQIGVVSQTLIDQFVHHPWMYFPAFYLFKQLLSGDDVYSAFSLYKQNLVEDLFALWKIWIPATMFNFAFSPIWMRIPVVAMTSLLWTMVLSYMRGVSEEDEEGDFDASETAFTYRWPKKRLDSEHSHLVVTFTGKDQIGMMAKITNTVVSKGGAIQESKVMSFGDSFAIMFLISSARRDQVQLEHAIDELSAEANINTNVLEAKYTDGIWKCSEQCAVFRMSFTGPDSEGLIPSITSIVSEHGFNIEKLKSGPALDNDERGESMCKIHLTVSHRENPELNEKDLEATLSRFAAEKDFSFEFEPVEIRPAKVKKAPGLSASLSPAVVPGRSIARAVGDAVETVSTISSTTVDTIAAELQPTLAQPALTPTV